jgi:hypothetical protein
MAWNALGSYDERLGFEQRPAGKRGLAGGLDVCACRDDCGFTETP